MIGRHLILASLTADEANNRYNQNPAANTSFIDVGTGLPVNVCADVVLTGAVGWIPAAAGAAGWRATPIPLSNQYPCRAVTISGNYHNPGMAQCGAAGQFYGVFAAGAHGLRVTGNDCLGCAHPDHPGGPHKCAAVGTGPAPHANSTLQGSMVDISVNSGDFEAAAMRALRADKMHVM